MSNVHFVDAANAFMFVVVVIMSLIAAYLLKKYEISWVPDSGAAMVIGFLFGGLILFFGRQESHEVFFKPEVFFFIMLPPIIFEAGFSMKRRFFFRNMTTIMLFAVLGTFISALVIGFALYGLAICGIVPLDSDSPLEALLFGSLISAVDPVATLSILGSKRVNADETLYALVFGESVLNDAVSIVLFNTFKSFHGKSFTNVTMLAVIGKFIGICLGSLCVGVSMALLLSYFLKLLCRRNARTFRFRHEKSRIFTLRPGIMSIFFCGICLAHYAWYNLSSVGKAVSKYAFDSFSKITETFLFAYLGIAAVLTSRSEFHSHWNVSLIFFTLVLCFVARALHIFPFSLMANCRRKKPITKQMMLIMWFAGLRGAIAFALSLAVPTAHSSVVQTTTITVVLFTTLVCGGFTERVVDRPEPHVATGLHRMWNRFDARVMKPYFGGGLPRVGKQVLEQSAEFEEDEADYDSEDFSDHDIETVPTPASGNAQALLSRL